MQACIVLQNDEIKFGCENTHATFNRVKNDKCSFIKYDDKMVYYSCPQMIAYWFYDDCRIVLALTEEMVGNGALALQPSTILGGLVNIYSVFYSVLVEL